MWDKFFDWIHKGQIIRRLIILWALVISTWIVKETWEWVAHFDKLDVGLATVVGAFLTPVLGLTGWLLKEYARNPYVEGQRKSHEE